MAETGTTQKEVTHGILKPLEKSNKAKGSPSNLRPIILLSSLRKILAACIPNRIKDRLKVEIPLLQAAYKPNRSTTARNESGHLIMFHFLYDVKTLSAKYSKPTQMDHKETVRVHSTLPTTLTKR